MTSLAVGMDRLASDAPIQSSDAVTVTGISRSFGAVRALSGATFTIRKGERLGLVGHNGAGKSTLMNVLSGVISPDEGVISIEGKEYAGLTPRLAHELGLRCVFQELSLCANLTAIENTLIRQRDLAGWAWRGRARRLIQASLERIFPGHGINLGARVGTLTIAQRQMVEIAGAFVTTGNAVRLVILDEPTSSLDARATEQLMVFLDTASRAGIATILISHRLQEILGHTDRVVVMVDGKVVGIASSDTVDRASLVGMMGHLEQSSRPAAKDAARRVAGGIVLQSAGDADDPLRLTVRDGEVIGFAGLDGHGQRAALRYIFAEACLGHGGLTKNSTAYVPGDRQVEGVFPVWSVGANATVRALPDLSSHGVIDVKRESQLAASWFRRIGVRAASSDVGITTLSGGNQQKVLFARALASQASLILLDDPMRGVDVGTKGEVYALIRREAEAGRSFIWYSTETEELQNCDRVYIFREGRIVAVLGPGEVTEESVLRASFSDAAADQSHG